MLVALCFLATVPGGSAVKTSLRSGDGPTRKKGATFMTGAETLPMLNRAYEWISGATGTMSNKLMGSKKPPLERYPFVDWSMTCNSDSKEENTNDMYNFKELAGAGDAGIAVVVERSAGRKQMIAKFDKITPSHPSSDLKHECDVFRRLQAAGVPNTLTCEAECIHKDKNVIILSPHIQDAFSVRSQLDPDEFNNDAALEEAMRSTIQTGWDMLKAGVANGDQGSNILYTRDGRTTFIDMGAATDLATSPISANTFRAVHMHVDAVLDKIPDSFWAEGYTPPQEVGMPVTPTKHLYDVIEYANQYIEQQVESMIISRGPSIQKSGRAAHLANVASPIKYLPTAWSTLRALHYIQ